MLDLRQQLINSTLSKVLQQLHYPLEVMLTCVRRYVAYPLRLQHVQAMMQERGVFVDHSNRRKRHVEVSWRTDETHIKVESQWKYLYRAVGRAADTVDFLLTAKRDKAAVQQFYSLAV